MIGLLASAWFFSNATPFPGYAAALPVIATAAVIVAGDTGRADPSGLVFRRRPVQWVGDVSYSIYLWHWPLVVFAPYVLGHNLRTPELVALVLLCLVVSGLSRRFVEDAMGFWPRLTRTPRATLSAALVGMLVIALVSGTQVYAADARDQQTAAMLADVSGTPCFGAPAMENRAKCPKALTAPPVVAITKTDAPWAPVPGCRGEGSDPSVLTCYWGKGKPAGWWRWSVTPTQSTGGARCTGSPRPRTGSSSRCSPVGVRRPTPGASSSSAGPGTATPCPAWTTKATARLRAMAPDDIITTAYAQQNVFDPPGSGPGGFERVWREWLGFTRVTVLRDIPTTGNRNGPQCLAVNVGKQLACSNPRSQVLVDDDMMRAARSMRYQVNLVDLSDYFCDARRCYAVIGGANVYFDYDHMSTQFSASLASPLLRRLPQS